MTTYREAIYMCLDLIKGISDDFSYSEEHVAYLLDKFRASLLKTKYGNDPKKLLPYSNYQRLNLTLNKSKINKSNKYLKYENKIPYLLNIGITRCMTTDEYHNHEFQFVSRERIEFVGDNKYRKNIIYCSINEDNTFIIRNKDSFYTNNVFSCEPIESVYLVGIFENPRLVEDEISIGETDGSEWIDRNIPIEEELIIPLIESVVKELLGASYRPKDNVNNSNDDLADMVSYIRRNMKSNLQKQIDNE